MQKETPEYLTWLEVTFALNDCREAGLVLEMLSSKKIHPDGLEWLRTTCSRQLGTRHAIWAAEAFHHIVQIQKTAREEKAMADKEMGSKNNIVSIYSERGGLMKEGNKTLPMEVNFTYCLDINDAGYRHIIIYAGEIRLGTWSPKKGLLVDAPEFIYEKLAFNCACCYIETIAISGTREGKP